MIKAGYQAHNSIVILILLLFFILPGCGHLIDPDPTQNEVENQKDLGSIHVTVFPPVEFETYKSALSPKFSLTGDQALQEVAPYTTAVQTNRYSGVSGGISANLGTQIGEKITTLTTKDGKTSEEINETITDKYGDVPESTTGSGTDKRVLTPDPYSQEIKRLDPLTRYWAAAALFQEVQLLNRYINDLDTDDDYQAYVARVQISQMPNIRRAPYNSITDLSFFIEVGNKTTGSTPIVLPMLVTDNLEAAAGNYSTETVRSLALALSGTIGSVGVGTNMDAYSQLKKDILGRDLNSLLTVARLHDNILRVRLGAMQQANNLYAVVPHNQTVSVVILVKRDNFENGNKPKLVVRSHSEWKHIEDPDKNLKNTKTTTAASCEDMNKLLKEYGYQPIEMAIYLEILRDYIYKDYGEFKTKVSSYLNPIPTTNQGVCLFSCEKKLQQLQKEHDDLKYELYKTKACLNTANKDSEGLKNKINKLNEQIRECQRIIAQYESRQKNLPGPFPGKPEDTQTQLTDDCRAINKKNPSAITDEQEHNAKLFWGLFAKHLAESAYDQTEISLPTYPKTPSVIVSSDCSDGSLCSNTQFYLFDNGKSKMQVTIPALGYKPFPARIYGEALFYYSCNKNTGNPCNPKSDNSCKECACDFPVFSTATALSNDQRGIVLTFPSVLSLGYQGLKPKALHLYWIKDKGDVSTRQSPIFKFSPTDGFEKLSLVGPAKDIKVLTKVQIIGNQEAVPIIKSSEANPKGNNATLYIYVPKLDSEDGGKITLLISGVKLSSAAGAAISSKDGSINLDLGKVVIDKEGGLTLDLANLVKDKTFDLVLINAHGVKSPLATLKAVVNK
jgi:hypothetical protein